MASTVSKLLPMVCASTPVRFLPGVHLNQTDLPIEGAHDGAGSPDWSLASAVATVDDTPRPFGLAAAKSSLAGGTTILGTEVEHTRGRAVRNSHLNEVRLAADACQG